MFAGKFVRFDGVTLSQGEPDLEITGDGGPRGSFWVTVPEGVAAAIGAPVSASLVEHWLATDVTVRVDVLTGDIRNWTIRGIRPRTGGGRARAQNGIAGLLKETFAGVGR